MPPSRQQLDDIASFKRFLETTLFQQAFFHLIAPRTLRAWLEIFGSTQQLPAVNSVGVFGKIGRIGKAQSVMP